MPAFDTSGWTQTPSGWMFSGTDATFDVLGGGSLEGPRTDPPADRIVSVYGTVVGEEYGDAKGQGRIIITGYNHLDLPIATAASAKIVSGVAAVSYTLPPHVMKYTITLVAFVAVGDNQPRGVTFKAVALGTPPVGGAAPGQVVTDENGEVVSRGPIKSTTVKPTIPTSQHRLIVGDKIDKNWYQYLQSLGDAVPTPAETEAQVAAAVGAIPAQEFKVHQTSTTEVIGNQDDGYLIGLRPLADSGAGTALVKLTRDEYGRVEGTEAATTDDLPEGEVNRYAVLPLVTGEIVSGQPVFVYADDGSLIYSGL